LGLDDPQPAERSPTQTTTSAMRPIRRGTEHLPPQPTEGWITLFAL